MNSSPYPQTYYPPVGWIGGAGRTVEKSLLAFINKKNQTSITPLGGGMIEGISIYRFGGSWEWLTLLIPDSVDNPENTVFRGVYSSTSNTGALWGEWVGTFLFDHHGNLWSKTISGKFRRYTAIETPFSGEKFQEKSLNEFQA